MRRELLFRFGAALVLVFLAQASVWKWGQYVLSTWLPGI
jgi:hypothetical protein